MLNHVHSRPSLLKTLIIALCFAAWFSPTPVRSNATPPGLVDELNRSLQFGEIVWLKAGQNRFLAIFTPDLTASPQGAAIILHDAGGHPDWPDVIRPLRTTLPKHHWATLSIALPRIENSGYVATQEKAINSRIDAAVRELIRRGLNNIVIIGHGSGAVAATRYLASMDQANISAFVAISLGVEKMESEDDYLPYKLEKITLPILDIYAANDHNNVTQSATLRSTSARKSSSKLARKQAIESFQRSSMATEPSNKIQGYIAYRQVVLDGADHNFRGMEQRLTKRILGWLMRHAKGVSVVKQ